MSVGSESAAHRWRPSVRAGLRQQREGPLPRAPQARLFLSSSFHVTAITVKFCSSPVTYCKTEDAQVLRYVASQNLRLSYIWYTVDHTDIDTVAEMTSSRADDRVERFPDALIHGTETIEQFSHSV